MSVIYKHTIEIEMNELIDTLSLCQFKEFVKTYMDAFDLSTQRDVVQECFNFENDDYLELINQRWLGLHFSQNIDYYLDKEEIKQEVQTQLLPDLDKKNEVKRFLTRLFAPSENYHLSNKKLCKHILSYLET